MPLLLWTVVVGLLTPYFPWLFMLVAKWRAGGYDNRHPRDQTAKLEGWGRRAAAAHQNGFEAVIPFVATALICRVEGGDPVWAGWLGVAWVVFRVGYTLAYVGDVHWLRSALFEAANACCLGLVVLAYRA